MEMHNNPINANKGEWSEFYTLLKLLSDGKLYAADHNLNKISEIFYPILKVITSKDSPLENQFDISKDDNSIFISTSGKEVGSIGREFIKSKTGKILVGIKNLPDDNTIMVVASGKIAATILTGAGAHDAASAKLIIEEAGGQVTDLFGCEQRYDRPIRGAIISNGILHTKLVETAKRFKK